MCIPFKLGIYPKAQPQAKQGIHASGKKLMKAQRTFLYEEKSVELSARNRRKKHPSIGRSYGIFSAKKVLC